METVIFVLLICFCLATSIADFRSYRIPLWANAGVMVTGFAWVTLHREPGYISAIIQALAVLSSLLTVRAVYHRLHRKTGLGMGDVLLASASSLWLTPSQVPLLLLISSLSALLHVGVMSVLRGKLLDRVPFGPFLCFGLIAILGLSRLGYNPMEGYLDYQ